MEISNHLSVIDRYLGFKSLSWTPSGSLKETVWTFLCAMMAAAAWLEWFKSWDETLLRALTVFGAQLSLNVVWSALFFNHLRN